jgi:hypothetical protein
MSKKTLLMTSVIAKGDFCHPKFLMLFSRKLAGVDERGY